MRSNLYVTMSGTLADGKAVNEIIAGCRGVIISAAQHGDPDHPGKVPVVNTIVGELGREVATGALAAVSEVLGRGGMLRLALRLALRPARKYEHRDIAEEA